MEILGFKKLPNWLKKKYLDAVKNQCQRCNSNHDLQIHRIKRGNLGGLYTVYPLNHKLNNIKVYCKDCHKLIHGLELGVTK